MFSHQKAITPCSNSSWFNSEGAQTQPPDGWIAISELKRPAVCDESSSRIEVTEHN